jgi:CxxC motif-containing protein (DUF1111 family)
MKTRSKTAIFCISFFLCASFAQAQPAIYKDADYKLGEKLIAESNCVACHVSKVGGNGSSIYKPRGSYQQRFFAARHGGAMQHPTQPWYVFQRT